MTDKVETDKSGERIAKVMARAGLCSRRDAETWIADGRVAVNGAAIASPALNVGPRDLVTVDGKPLPGRERTRLFLHHKPRGLVTTHSDPQGRPTIFERLPKDLPRLISVGRLDLATEGLLLLTNDGGLARALELPSTGWLRRYRVRANGTVTQPDLDKLSRGVTVEGVRYGPIEAKLDRPQGANVWLTMAIREGKNREIRNVLRSLNLAVNRLIRISFGPFQLGDLPEGAAEEVKTRVLREQLGERLATLAGVDFAAPVMDRAAEPAASRGRPPRGNPPARKAQPSTKAEQRDATPRVRSHEVKAPRGQAVQKPERTPNARARAGKGPRPAFPIARAAPSAVPPNKGSGGRRGGAGPGRSPAPKRGGR